MSQEPPVNNPMKNTDVFNGAFLIDCNFITMGGCVVYECPAGVMSAPFSHVGHVGHYGLESHDPFQSGVDSKMSRTHLISSPDFDREGRRTRKDK